MHRYSLRRMVVRLLVVMMLGWGVPVRSQTPVLGPDWSPPASAGQAAAVLVVVGAAIGVGVYFIARAPRTTGCVVQDGSGLALQGSGPGDPGYVLEGATGSLHDGERVKVVGRRHARADGRKVVKVKGVAKRYGACSGMARVGAVAAP